MEPRKEKTVLEVIEENLIFTKNQITFLKLEEQYLSSRMIFEKKPEIGQMLGECQAKLKLNLSWLDFIQRRHKEEAEKVSKAGGAGADGNA